MCEKVIVRFSPEIEQALLSYLLSSTVKQSHRKDPIKPSVREYLVANPNKWINRKEIIEITGLKSIVSLQSMIASLRYRGYKIESGRRGAGMYRYILDNTSKVAVD